MHDTHTVTSEVENSVQVSYFKLLFVHVVEIEIYMQERTPENKIKKKTLEDSWSYGLSCRIQPLPVIGLLRILFVKFVAHLKCTSIFEVSK